MYIEIIKWNWNREFADEATEQGNFDVYFYEDKEEAISEYKKDKSDLVLTDSEVYLCCEVINI